MDVQDEHESEDEELYPLLATLKRLGMELTRENYLSLERWEPYPRLSAEEEFELPPQFRKFGSDSHIPRCIHDEYFDECEYCLTHPGNDTIQ